MTRATQWTYGWLLLLPAMALLALFTHYPAVATLWHSFFSTQKGSRPVVRAIKKPPCFSWAVSWKIDDTAIASSYPFMQ